MNARQFLDGLAEQSIIATEELLKVRRVLTSEQLAAAPAAIAREFVRQGKLTRFQAAEVFQGRGRGLVFGDYLVLDKLGEGGMGQVYKAEHRRMKRLVALKVLPPHSTSSKPLVDRFYKEVELAARLIHPNIVTAYDAGESRGLHYLAMEYVDGRDLSSVLKTNGPFGVEQAMNCILQAARGLQYAHDQGIIHRDIKPSNLIANSRGVVKILDMGLARVEHSFAAPVPAGASELTDSGQVLGTVDYMAPEQSYDSRLADHRSDIYSLGCTLYRLLTGSTMYVGDTMMQKLLAHRELPAPSLREARDDLPPALDALYQRMVAKLPDDRPKKMRDVVTTLESLLAGVSDEASTVTHLERLPTDDEGLDSFLQRMSASGVGLGSNRSLSTSETPSPAVSATLRIEPSPGSNRVRRPKKAPQPLIWGVAIGITSVAFVVIASLFLHRSAPPGEVPQADAKTPAEGPKKSKRRLDDTVAGKPKPKPPDKKDAGPSTPKVDPPAEQSVAPPITPPPEMAQVQPPAAGPDDQKKVEPLAGPMNVLEKVDKTPGLTHGNYNLDNAGLTATDARLQFDVVPPDEYDLTAVITDLNQQGELQLGLPVQNRATTLVFQHTYKSVWDIGLGKQGWRTQRALALADSPLTILCAVRKHRLFISFDGRTAVDWVEGPGVPTLESNLVDERHRPGMILKAKFRVASLQIAPPSAKLPIYQRYDLLAEIDAARDRASGVVRADQGDLLLSETPDKVGSGIAFSSERPSDYVLTAVVERTLGCEQIEFGLPTGLARAVAAVDRVDGAAQLVGLAGGGSLPDRLLISPWRLHTVVCTARGGSLRLDVDGQEVAFTETPLNEGHLLLAAGVKDPGAFFARTDNTSAFRLHRLELAPADAKKLPRPSDDALSAAAKDVESVVSSLREARSKTPGASPAAQKLWREATQTSDDAARRWVLLDAAAQQAAADGDLVMASHAAIDLARAFDANLEAWAAKVFPVALRTAKTTAARGRLASEAVRQIEMAVALEEFDVAAGMTSAVLSLKSLPADIQKELRSRNTEIAYWRELQTAARESLTALAGSPDSADDHRAAGQYLAVVRGDWQAAATHLSKAGDTEWAELAARESKESAAPAAADAADALTVGDRWWAIYTKAPAPLKWWCMERAAAWYRRAAPTASAKIKSTLESKSKLLARQRNSSSNAFRARHPLDALRIGDRWYKVYPTPTTWRKAEAMCRDLGGSLPIGNTPQENQAIIQALKSGAGGNERRLCWLGGSDQAQEGEFRWLDGSPVSSGFTNWRSGEPDNAGGQQDYMAMLVVFEKGEIKSDWTDEVEAGPCLCVCVWDD